MNAARKPAPAPAAKKADIGDKAQELSDKRSDAASAELGLDPDLPEGFDPDELDSDDEEEVQA